METVTKLKRVVIKEELYTLTNDTIEAIILGQLIYWQDKVNDFDSFINDEKKRGDSNGIEINIENLNGWIYKKANELSDECMLNISEVTMRRYLQKLIDKKFIYSRTNPVYKWDRTIQYRVNLKYVITEIIKRGYNGLGGYNLSVFKNEETNLQNECSELNNEGAIPYTTYIDYNRERKEDTIVSKKELNPKEIVDYWNNNTKSFSKVQVVSAKIKTAIKARQKDGYSIEDIKKAILLCESLPDFYKGKEKGKNWKADFTWLINNTKGNFDKILSGALHNSSSEKREYDMIMNLGNSSYQEIYSPQCDGMTLSWNNHSNAYLCYYEPGTMQFADGYKDSERPNGATVVRQGIKYTWNKESNKWISSYGN